MIWKLRVTGINKDMVNLTSVAADGIQLVLSGPHLITWHYDSSPPWNKFVATNGVPAGDTVLEVVRRAAGVTPGATNHIGFETPGTVSVRTILAMNWLSGTNVIAPAPRSISTSSETRSSSVHNDFYPGALTLANARLELYSNAPPLDKFDPNGQRNPMAVSAGYAAERSHARGWVGYSRSGGCAPRSAICRHHRVPGRCHRCRTPTPAASTPTISTPL